MIGHMTRQNLLSTKKFVIFKIWLCTILAHLFVTKFKASLSLSQR